MNPFASLSAESPEHRMAVVSTLELQEDVRATCTIHRDDIGDEDRHLYLWEVWDGVKVVFETTISAIEAATWANANGYRIVSQ
jgi:hypothetical protein